MAPIIFVIVCGLLAVTTITLASLGFARWYIDTHREPRSLLIQQAVRFETEAAKTKYFEIDKRRDLLAHAQRLRERANKHDDA